ncbi:MAG: O-antigen ligase family protein [Patescibacteria group bacterium]
MVSKLIGIKDLFFLFFFSILLLCQFLLGETYLGIVTGGAFIVLVCFFVRELDWNQLKYQSNIFVISVWLLYLFFLCVSAFFTHNLPLSLQSIFFSGIYFIVFVFFLLVSSNFLNKSFLFLILILIGGVLFVISTLVRLNLEWAIHLPGMNFIYETYGHNHIASYIILINPIIFLLNFKKIPQNREEKKYFDKFEKHKFLYLYVFFNLLLLTTFARVAILIGFFQLSYVFIFLHSFNKRASVIKLQTSFDRITLFFLGILFIGIIAFKLFFSVVQIIQPSFVCPFPSLQNKLCKNLDKDLRSEYWREAFQGVKNYPLTGYGPGTFQLISSKYRATSYAFTTFSHNSFLQVFSESGIFTGVFFILLFVSIFLVVLSHARRNLQPFSEQSFLLVALLSTSIDSFFDFSWSFSALFLVVVILIAIILRGTRNTQSKKMNDIHLKHGLLMISTITCIFIFAYSILFLLNESLLSQRKFSTAFQIFPYYFYQRKAFLTSQSLTPEQTTFFQQIYRSDSETYVLTDDVGTAVNSIQDNNTLFILDPWKLVFFSTQDLRDFKKMGLNQDTVFNLAQFVIFAEKNTHGQNLTFEQKKILANKTLYFADELLLSGQAELAGKLYVLSHALVHFSIQDHEYKLQHVTGLELEQFLTQLNQIPADNFGIQNRVYAQKYWELAKWQFDQNEFEKTSLSLHRAIDISPGTAHLIWPDISRMIQEKMNVSKTNKDLDSAKKSLAIWSDTRQLMLKKAGYIDDKYQVMLASSLIQVGNETVHIDFDYLLENYKTALSINPWIFNSKTGHFLDVESVESIKSEDAQKYFDSFENYYPKINEGRKAKSYQLLLYLCLHLYEQGNLEGVKKYLALAEFFKLSDNTSLDLFIRQLETQAEESLQKNNPEETVMILRFMNVLKPNDFWITQQLGNYFLSVGDKAEMEVEYSKCVSEFPGSHQDCLHQGYSDKDRFKKVGEIIKGEKTWQQVFQ